MFQLQPLILISTHRTSSTPQLIDYCIHPNIAIPRIQHAGTTKALSVLFALLSAQATVHAHRTRFLQHTLVTWCVNALTRAVKLSLTCQPCDLWNVSRLVLALSRNGKLWTWAKYGLCCSDRNLEMVGLRPNNPTMVYQHV